MQAVRDSVIFGSASSAFTTVIYQPLELIKTRAQLESNTNLFGSLRRLTKELIKTNGVKYLWRGTGAVSRHPSILSQINLLQNLTPFRSQCLDPCQV